MGFVFVRDFTFDWPVTVRVPAAGKHEVRRFTATFRLLPGERVAALQGDARQLIEEALLGWDGVTDEAGRPIPCEAEAKRALLDLPFVLVGLAEAYAEALAGGAERKN